jgi:hypothetical protein
LVQSQVTNKDVNRALRELVWPALKPVGFGSRTGRVAWRDGRDQVDVVNFWSHNAYNAGALGINTLSFQLELGVFPRCRADEHTPVKDGLLRPKDAHCEFRQGLRPPFDQAETDRPEIWFIRSDGTNLHEVVEAARDTLLTDGLDWFRSLDGLERMLEVVRHTPDRMDGTWGMGHVGSPNRIALIAALEAAAG